MSLTMYYKLITSDFKILQLSQIIIYATTISNLGPLEDVNNGHGAISEDETVPFHCLFGF